MTEEWVPQDPEDPHHAPHLKRSPEDSSCGSLGTGCFFPGDCAWLCWPGAITPAISCCFSLTHTTGTHCWGCGYQPIGDDHSNNCCGTCDMADLNCSGCNMD